MPLKDVMDCEGNPFQVEEINGMNFMPFDHLDDLLKALPSLKAKDDDVTLVAYPKSGTHWVWEITQLLKNGKAELTEVGKMETFLEVMTADSINELPSPRFFNTHLPPAFLPADLYKRKSKFIYVVRNPKDVYVSYFHHIKSLATFNYNNTWNGFLSLVFDNHIPFGTWFDYTNTWDAFFSKNPDVPVLTLLYEDMLKDMSGGVQKIADFLNVQCSKELKDRIVQQCTFSNMKAARDASVSKTESLKGIFKGNNYPLFRKGKVGDWKTMFTVAQNERFDKMYEEKMIGSPISFKEYIGV